VRINQAYDRFHRRVPTLSAEISSTGNSVLCVGNLLEYRALVRRLDPNLGNGIVIVLASCYFGNPKMTLFFDGYNLMQTPPSEIHPQYDTFYVASVTSPLVLGDPPPTVTVTDGFGSHVIPVADWNSLPSAEASPSR
jgi:hypothetical protein